MRIIFKIPSPSYTPRLSSIICALLGEGNAVLPCLLCSSDFLCCTAISIIPRLKSQSNSGKQELQNNFSKLFWLTNYFGKKIVCVSDQDSALRSGEEYSLQRFSLCI